MNKNIINISYYNNKFNFNFNNRINKSSKNIKNKNIELKINTIDNNYKSIDDIQFYNIYNNERFTNIINSFEQNKKNYSANKYFSTNNILLNSNKNKNGTNILIKSIDKDINKGFFFNNNNNQNIISKNKRIDKKIIIKRGNNYRTLYEREKEKEKYKCRAKNKHNLKYFFRNCNRINQLNEYNRSTKMHMSLKNKTLNSKDIIGNSSQKIIIGNNFYNNPIDNASFNKKMKISTSTNNIKNNVFQNNIKKLQINKYNLLNNSNSSQNIYYRNTLKEHNNLCISYDRNSFNNMIKYPKINKNYNKYKININSSKNNKIPTINFYSFNSNTYNNSNKISLTEQDGNIKFMNIYENKFRIIKDNNKNSFIFNNK
jgi:hypothetical protein